MQLSWLSGMVEIFTIDTSIKKVTGNLKFISIMDLCFEKSYTKRKDLDDNKQRQRN